MRPLPFALVALVFLVFLGAALPAAASIDPVSATKQGADVALGWAPDTASSGYSIYKVDGKDKLLTIVNQPIYRNVVQASPAFPVLDAGAIAAPPAVAFYQVFLKQPCTRGKDTDGDRLDDCDETNTGTFVSASDTGTDPNNPDTDGDGISDGDEVLGTLGGLPLYLYGANPVHKDLFIEYDWFDDSLECGAHSHKPTWAMLDLVSAAFAAAPVKNPDGLDGIVVHHDIGQDPIFSGGGMVDDPDGVIAGGVNDVDFQAIKAANFRVQRQGYFHYCLLPHRYNISSGSSGQAEFPGNDFIVSLYCANSTQNVANTIVHEIGHNFTLGHGGFENCNWKPNYNSVMNYKYQFPGADNDCTPPGNGVLDYSHGTRIDLDENNLDENRGTCGTVPVDWNGDGNFESGIAYDLNRTGDSPTDSIDDGGCGAALMVIKDNDDWKQLDLATGLRDPDFRLGPRPVVDCNPNPPMPRPGGR